MSSFVLSSQITDSQSCSLPFIVMLYPQSPFLTMRENLTKIENLDYGLGKQWHGEDIFQRT